MWTQLYEVVRETWSVEMQQTKKSDFKHGIKKRCRFCLDFRFWMVDLSNVSFIFQNVCQENTKYIELYFKALEITEVKTKWK